jgi:N-acetylglucosaminyl-diphospho-decaprenol L-rhamnosyltransferase
MTEGAPVDATASYPEVRVGIVSWNTEALLDRCLASLPGALGTLRAEVVVVDNASTDKSAEVARSYPGVTVVVRATNAGYAVAMNEALEGSVAPVLLALNPDTELPVGAVARLVADLGQHTEAGLVVPALVGGDGRPQRSVYPYPGVVAALEVGFVPSGLRRRGAARRRDGHGGDLGRRWAIGAVHCIRAAALAGEAPYSERWFIYGEDIELCWRLRRAGWQVRELPAVTVVHHGNAAGRQRWGEGAELELRSLPNIYEWLWTERSAALGRATAAVNVGGLVAKGLALRLASVVGSGGSGARRAQRAAELERLRRYHGGVLRHGPRYVEAEVPPTGP